MNALFPKDLALKTRRGLEGRVRSGYSAGGLSYGYDAIHEMDASGQPARGKRRINETQAKIIQRISDEYAAGRSPRDIARRLNAECIAAPGGGAWGPSTINGNRKRGTDILNNELYTGRLVWNRLQFVKDPTTGKPSHDRTWTKPGSCTTYPSFRSSIGRFGIGSRNAKLRSNVTARRHRANSPTGTAESRDICSPGSSSAANVVAVIPSGAPFCSAAQMPATRATGRTDSTFVAT